MFYLLIFVAFVISWIFGVFGFSQIIGSLQTKQKGFLFTILIWIILLGAVYFGIRHFLGDYIIGCYIGAVEIGRAHV